MELLYKTVGITKENAKFNSIQRRTYDSINVIAALGYIIKNRKALNFLKESPKILSITKSINEVFDNAEY